MIHILILKLNNVNKSNIIIFYHQILNKIHIFTKNVNNSVYLASFKMIIVPNVMVIIEQKYHYVNVNLVIYKIYNLIIVFYNKNKILQMNKFNKITIMITIKNLINLIKLNI